MGRPRVYHSLEEKRERDRDVKRARRAHRYHTFIPIDGEGIGRGRDHKYVLLGTDTEYIQNPDGLGPHEIFRFLWEQYLSSPESVMSGFYLGYDFCQWLKGLPESRARMLFTEEGKAVRKRTNSGDNPIPFPVYWEDWEMDILGVKRFKLRPKGERSWLYVNDSGPFFQSSLLTAINPQKWVEPICTPEEYALIEEGKARRDHAELDDEMIEYMLLENTILKRLLSTVDHGLKDVGINLNRDQWFGPGQAAQKFLATTDAPKVRIIAESALREWQEYGRLSYFGGWFEIFAHGIIPGDSWEYDINSAYPFVASRLPCLLHGRWSHNTNRNQSLHSEERMDIVRGTFKGSNCRIGALLYRDEDGNISRPQQVTGWYWGNEVRAAIRAGLVDECSIEETVVYDPCDCDPPLRSLADLYADRLSVGKDTPAGKQRKNVYNSAYGKFAQSIGNPKFANSLYASLITSGCRTQILDAIGKHPGGTEAVLMVATDAVFFRSRHPDLELSDKLGAWDEKSRTNLTLFKPGVYWDDSAREAIAKEEPAIFKARGINAKAFSRHIQFIDNRFREWTDFPLPRDPVGEGRDGWWPQVSFESGFSMVTCQQALARGKWFMAGAIGPGKHEDDSWPGLKRRSGEMLDGVYWSRPPGVMWEPSHPYTKRFGIPESEETIDGPLLTLISEALRG